MIIIFYEIFVIFIELRSQSDTSYLYFYENDTLNTHFTKANTQVFVPYGYGVHVISKNVFRLLEKILHAIHSLYDNLIFIG
jgi:hypothetical protein